MSSNRISLAAQLAQLDQPAPADVDPEDLAVLGAVDPEDASSHRGNPTHQQGREHYIDVGPSTLRKLRDSVTDPKYDGKRISRKQLQDSDDFEIDDEEQSVPGDEDDQHPMTSEEEDDALEEESGKEEKSNIEDVDEQEYESRQTGLARAASPPPATANDELSSTLKRTREEERKKGKAVARQLAMYDSLLDARIRLQKCVTSMNRLPDSAKIPDFLLDAESRDAADRLLKESVALSDELFDLQEKLMTSNESLSPPARKRQKLTDESDVDWEEELRDRTGHFAKLESSFHPHLLVTLQKWSNKVLAIAPSALLPSNRTKFTRNNANVVKSAVQLVDEALLDRDGLIAHTRVWRGKGARLCAPSDENLEAADVFDDTDFYQALLRSVIDSRSGAMDDMTADWRAAQKQRKTSKKSAVDTRASKGRKLRYEAHEKLAHFMAPVPQPLPPGASAQVRWHEAQIDELFASLLGRGFAFADAENGIEHDNALGRGEPALDVDVGDAIKSGFRVFG